MSNDVWLVNTTYSCNCHPELISVSCGLNPSPAFQAPSAQGRQGHTHRIALRFPLSPTREENFHYFLTLHQIINRSCPIQINISKNIQYNSGSKEIIVIGRSYSQH